MGPLGAQTVPSKPTQVVGLNVGPETWMLRKVQQSQLLMPNLGKPPAPLMIV